MTNEKLSQKVADSRAALKQILDTSVEVLSITTDRERNQIHVWATPQQMKELAWATNQPLEFSPFDERWDEVSYKIGTATVFCLIEKE